MKIAMGCDHRGFDAKRKLLPLLRQRGHEVKDFGCDGAASCDYPDFAVPVARAVASGQFELGVLIDGSGMGMSMAANKVRGVRAATVHDEVSAKRAREHHFCNVLCIGADLSGEEQVRSIVEAFLGAVPEQGRHSRRVKKVIDLETEEFEKRKL
jgi:ribose 5-phosphate isomerase B